MQVIENRENNSTRLSETFAEQREELTTLELFAGAGGLALGTHTAGFKHKGLIEYDTFAVQTLQENSQKVLDVDPSFILHCDVRTVDYTQFTNKIDLLTGGPPCQPFSNSGSSLGPDDPRDMFPTFLDAVAIIKPKAILIENVKGLLREKFKDYFDYILRRLHFPYHRKKLRESWQDHYLRLLQVKESDFVDDEKYLVTYQLVNTADYGVPQRRERILITAFRYDLGIEKLDLPSTHSKEMLLAEQWISGIYWEKYGISPIDYLSSFDRKMLERLRREPFLLSDKLPWRTVRDAIYDLPKPVDRGIQEEIPNHIQHPGAREYQGHFASVFDYPAKVLKAGTHGTPGGENMVRVPEEDIVRYFTTREAARLQTFPDDWRFHGTWGACIKQLGNAVPVELIRIFATAIRYRLDNVLEKRSQA